jgi:hypothetical protein
VHEYEELIHLPTAESVKSEISIHESNRNKVKEGLPANITVDALPGKVFYGTVNKIAVMPNAQMVFINPDLKVYTTDVFVDSDSKDLRTGMSCKTEIIVEEHENVMFVPVQAVVRIGDQPTVYVMDGSKMKPQSIEIGMDNNRMVHVLSGLEVGDKVVLTPPLIDTQLNKNSTSKRPGGKRPSQGNKQEGTKKPDQGTGSGKKPQGGFNASSMINNLKKMDTNSDGKISIADEVDESTRPFIQRADSNKDGFIDQKELKAIADAMKNRAPGGGQAPGGKR